MTSDSERFIRTQKKEMMHQDPQILFYLIHGIPGISKLEVSG